LIFSRKVYPTIDPAPEARLLDNLRDAIFNDTATVEPEIAIVVSLANAIGLLPAHFDKKKLKGRKRRLERIAEGGLAGAATREAVQAAQAAAMAAIIAATTVTTITSATR
ncbi:MAG: GPP34 family phosphoprotein, partial [Acidobacteriota bacterium]|nr:GPP34 family phosphoprotein [Acidobacteriota bacterium]